jgi:hypothetical protein
MRAIGCEKFRFVSARCPYIGGNTDSLTNQRRLQYRVGAKDSFPALLDLSRLPLKTDASAAMSPTKSLILLFVDPLVQPDLWHDCRIARHRQGHVQVQVPHPVPLANAKFVPIGP